MAKSSKNPIKYAKKRPILAATSVAVAIGLGVGIAMALNNGNNSDSQNISSPTTNTGNSANNKKSQPSRNGSSSTLVQGGAIDTKGTGVPSSTTTPTATSSSGLISLYTPSSSSTLRSGDVISGTAKVNPVHYRLVDDEVGVIAQGSLTVVNRKFSGTIHFLPHASSGQLDLFSYNSDGVEVNSIRINLSLGK